MIAIVISNRYDPSAVSLDEEKVNVVNVIMQCNVCSVIEDKRCAYCVPI